MAHSSLRFAKIVATPTDAAWSQAYNASSIFAVLSLTKSKDIEPDSLNAIGKEILSLLHSEFFGLEDKSLPELKKVVADSIKSVPASVLISFVIAFNKSDILYLLTVTGGKVLMRRQGETGILMDHVSHEPDREIHAASGVLQSDDIIILQTQEFSEKVTKEKLEEALSLDLPNDIAEVLTPNIHNSEQGASASIVLSYHGEPAVTEPEIEDELKTSNFQEVEEKIVKKEEQKKVEEIKKTEEVAFERDELSGKDLEESASKKRFPISLPPLPRSSRGLLIMTIILITVLVTGIILTKNAQEQSKVKNEFEKIYQEASDAYDTGEGLLSMETPLTRESFLKAQSILQNADGLVNNGSEEKKKYDQLKQKIGEKLKETSGVKNVAAKEVELSESKILNGYQLEKTAISVTQDDTSVFILSPDSIISMAKSDEDKSTLIENDDAWDKGVSIGAYLGNIYILDTQKRVLKFVKSGNEYVEGNYFKNEPDMSKAVALTIDGSIYVLFSNGTIQKFTKGVEDTFKISSLPSALSAPTKIYTTADLENLYILEPKTSRIVVLDKNGAFIKEISSTVLKAAKDLEVAEDEKTAFVLSGNKLYSISIE